ncbi:MAG: class I SAM-dependent methyltransferase [Patescibacteria group bacterium]|nr:class I SAM-dependent methyltransferase [Patescibacteria group bacterium]
MKLEKIPPTLPGQDYGLRVDWQTMIDAMIFPNRRALAENCRGRLCPLPVCCEIGVLNGDFSKWIWNIFAPSKIYLIDLIIRPLVSTYFHPHAVFLEGDSSTVIQKIPDETIDYLYIDGDHSYDGICKDIRASWPKVKPGGIIQFNDYCTWSPAEDMEYGVLNAVNALIEEMQTPIIGLSLDRSGYHDIAIRKPLN